MATTDTERRDGQPDTPTPDRGRGQREVPDAPPPAPTAPSADSPKPTGDPPPPRRRRDNELRAIEHALQALEGDTQAIAATSQCLSALAGVEDSARRGAIAALLGQLHPDLAGLKLAKVVLEDRWTRQAG